MQKRNILNQLGNVTAPLHRSDIIRPGIYCQERHELDSGEYLQTLCRFLKHIQYQHSSLVSDLEIFFPKTLGNI